MKNLKVSESSNKMKELINEAIHKHTITRDEYDTIINIATADNVIDIQEQTMLSELHDMIEDKTIKIVAS